MIAAARAASSAREMVLHLLGSRNRYVKARVVNT